MRILGRWATGSLVMAVFAASCSGGSADPSPNPTASTGCASSTANELRAVSLSFDRHCIAVAADVPTTLAFSNDDAGESHNVAIYPATSCLGRAVKAGREPRCEQPTDAAVFRGTMTVGVAAAAYDLPAMAAGLYVFVCEVHLFMHGAFRVA